MATGLDARAAELFMRAMDLPAAQRSEFVDAVCAGDPALREEVASLLAADADLSQDRPDRRDPAAALVGTRLGRYRLVRLLGSGGMGAVYEAEQENPRRSVALKLMRSGFPGGHALRRFEHESQVLARLSHPGIAQVYEAGTHRPPGAAHDLPFFVMEFVRDARPIVDYFAAAGLDTRRRLELFARVCDAVHHGHTKGVIHRDIKPGNVLVDGSGQPKVIDFGVARATDSDIATATVATGVGQLIGTLRYMSPEQCDGDPGAIDTRSDVYALGVVLFELLTGRLPYELQTRTIYEAPRIIREQPPTRPSAINRGLRGDVETIVLKALEKDRERRYASAAELAADLTRFLRSEPIAARPARRIYHARMFARRNRGLVGGIGVAFLALAVGLAAALRQTSRARAALERSEHHAYVAGIAAAAAAIRADDAATAQATLQAAPGPLRGWEWGYLWARADRSVRTWENHGCYDMAVSPDGTSAITTLGDRTVKLLDAATLRERWSVTIPQELVANEPHLSVTGAFSRDGRLVTTSYGGTVLLWDVGDGRLLGHMSLPSQPWWGYLDIALHPDGHRIAINGLSWTAQVWDLSTGLRIADLSDRWPGAGLDYGPDGALLALNTTKGPVLLNSDSLDLARTLTPPPQRRATGPHWRSVRFSPDGSEVAFADGPFIDLYRVADGSLRTTLQGHTQIVQGVAYSPDGTQIASGSWDRTVRLWDAAPGRLAATLLGHTGELWNVSFSDAGTHLLSVSGSQELKQWSAHPTPDVPQTEHAGIGLSLQFAPDGRTVLVASPRVSGYNGGLDRWDLQSDHSERLLGPAQGALGVFCLNPALDRALITRPDEQLALVEVGDGREIWRSDALPRVAHWHAPVGQPATIIVRLLDDSVLSVDPDNGRPIRTLCSPQPGGPPPMCDDGGHLFLAHHGAINLVDPRSGILRRFSSPEPGRSSTDLIQAAVSPDESLLATGHEDGTVAIWDFRAGRVLQRIGGLNPGVYSLAFSPDGRRLAAGSKDRSVRIIDPRTGEQLLVLGSHAGTVMALAWSSDGRRLASSGYDGVIRVWDAGSAPHEIPIPASR